MNTSQTALDYHQLKKQKARQYKKERSRSFKGQRTEFESSVDQIIEQKRKKKTRHTNKESPQKLI